MAGLGRVLQKRGAQFLSGNDGKEERLEWMLRWKTEGAGLKMGDPRGFLPYGMRLLCSDGLAAGRRHCARSSSDSAEEAEHAPENETNPSVAFRRDDHRDHLD